MSDYIKITETPSHYDHLEEMDTLSLLKKMNAEDQKVAEAVHACIPEITKLVDAIIPRFTKGGRLFYIGAGTSGRLGILDASEIPPTFGMPFDRVVGLIAGGDTAIRKAVEPGGDGLTSTFTPASFKILLATASPKPRRFASVLKLNGSNRV